MRLRRLQPNQLEAIRREAVDGTTLAAAAEIVADVREGGTEALRRWAERFGERTAEQPLRIDRDQLQRTFDGLPADQRALLERAAKRIKDFALAQRAVLQDLSMPVPGGKAGHSIAAVQRAGCYAPGGRYPLPSSVLMTAVTARAAGVSEVWVASPRPAEITLAAAAVAGADGLLAVGGAQAIAALAFGAGGGPPCDVVVGPGNRWVTAAKKLVAGDVGIDMLAGPSELVILADESANPAVVAADLLAQAEHDPEALPILISTERAFADAVDLELESNSKGFRRGTLPPMPWGTGSRSSPTLSRMPSGSVTASPRSISRCSRETPRLSQSASSTGAGSSSAARAPRSSATTDWARTTPCLRAGSLATRAA